MDRIEELQKELGEKKIKLDILEKEKQTLMEKYNSVDLAEKDSLIHEMHENDRKHEVLNAEVKRICMELLELKK